MKQILILSPILAVLMIALTSCSSIGVKEKHTVVYVTLGQHDESLYGLIRVATNDKIPVSVGDIATELNVGGYYVVAEQDLKTFRDQIKKANKK